MAKIFRFTLKHNMMSYPFLVAVVVFLIAGCYETIPCLGSERDFETLHLFYDNPLAIYLAFAVAVLPPLLTGREFTSGTVRNKLITGTSKKAFFVSHLLVNSVLTVILTVVYFLPSFVLCTKYYNMFKPYMVAYAIFCVALGYLAVTALSTVISLMSNRMLISLVAVLLVTISFALVDGRFGAALYYPKYDVVDYTDRVVIDESGDKVWVSEPKTTSPNPFFVEPGTKRTLMWTVKRILPFEIILNGTGVLGEHLTSNDAYEHSKKEAEIQADGYPQIKERCDALFYLPLYQLGFIAVVSCLGLFLFDRRNIK